MKLHWQILIALVAAVIVGTSTSLIESLIGVDLYPLFDFFGALFLNALKMIIVPLIVTSIVSGMAGVEQGSAFARLGGKTFVYYISTTTIAVLLGLTLVNAMQPGIIDGQPAKEVLGLSSNTEEVTASIGDAQAGDMKDIFLRMIPVNVIQAAAQGQMLGLIFFSLLFGYFVAQVPKANGGAAVKSFFEGTLQVMMKITDLVMRFAPIGVFALVAKVVSVTGIEVFLPLANFFFTVLMALALHMFLVMPILLMMIGRVSPRMHFRAMLPALLTAFSTSSSSATLPISLDCVENRAGVSNRTTSFVLPLGATINMDGTALYECVAALFIAQAYGVTLDFTQQFFIVVLALLTSIGVAGVPAASLVAITIILTAMGLPIEGIGLILAVDRILDMCRTTVNVFSDSCGAVVIARSEGEETALR